MASTGGGLVGHVFGGPTKRFFVSMLPKDIELSDAILDLIDNCVDGAMRQVGTRLDEERPFEGYYANLTIEPDAFGISDNCGGIPEDYVEAAFSLGRPTLDKDSTLPTIGMYGIGMKRSIFKIANEAYVESNSTDGFFEVVYSNEWLDPENDAWDLPITRGPKKQGDAGVTVAVTDVKSEIARRFGNTAFLNRLRDEVSEHFGYLIQRGFSIIVNDEELKPRTLGLISVEHSDQSEIRPFDFFGTADGVDIKVTIGFFRALVREQEIDSELLGAREQEKAGISVVCNDRVVLLADRTMKTGWGDGGVPRFHPQFRAIAGLVVFTSTHAENLPISTTKRDLDVGADVYLTARKQLMEGLKIFTDFTNKWKGIEDETNEFFDRGRRTDAKTQVSLAITSGRSIRGQQNAKKYVPTLPLPEVRNPRRRISFVRDESQIREVSRHLFDDSNQNPSIIGAECFDRTLKRAREQ